MRRPYANCFETTRLRGLALEHYSVLKRYICISFKDVCSGINICMSRPSTGALIRIRDASYLISKLFHIDDRFDLYMLRKFERLSFHASLLYSKSSPLLLQKTMFADVGSFSFHILCFLEFLSNPRQLSYCPSLITSVNKSFVIW